MFYTQLDIRKGLSIFLAMAESQDVINWKYRNNILLPDKK